MQCHYHSGRQATVLHFATGQALCDTCNVRQRHKEAIELLLNQLYRLRLQDPQKVYDLHIDRDGITAVYPSSLWEACERPRDVRLFLEALLFLMKRHLVSAQMDVWPLGVQVKTLRNIRLTAAGVHAGAKLYTEQTA